MTPPIATGLQPDPHSPIRLQPLPAPAHQSVTHYSHRAETRITPSQVHGAGVSGQMYRSNSFEKFNRRVSKKAKRDFFAARWRDFVRATFPRGPEEIIRHFDVTFQTACNWWNGVCCPFGDEVNAAWEDYPDAARAYLTGRRLAA